MPSNSSCVIFIKSSSSNATDSSCSCALIGNSFHRYFRIRSMAWFTAILRSQAYSEPSPLYLNDARRSKAMRKVSCNISSASCLLSLYLRHSVSNLAAYRVYNSCCAARSFAEHCLTKSSSSKSFRPSSVITDNLAKYVFFPEGRPKRKKAARNRTAFFQSIRRKLIQRTRRGCL